MAGKRKGAPSRSVSPLADGGQRDGGALRQRAELRVGQAATTAPDNLNGLPNEQLHRLFSELQVHQIELEMQNEELLLAQRELEVSRARYFDLFDFAPISYLSLDRQGLIIEANFTAASVLGLPRESLVQKPFHAFILRADQDIFYRQCLELLDTGARQSFELRMVRNGAPPFWAQVGMTSSMDAAGEFFTRLVLEDIDAKRRLEESSIALAKEKELILIERDKHHMEQLVQSDKLAALGMLVAGVAHEINNPNHAIMLNAGFVERVWKSLVPVMERHFDGSEDMLVGGIEYADIRSLMPASIAALVEAASTIDQIVQGLKSFAAPDSASFSDDIDLNAVAKASAALVSGFIKKATSRFSIEFDPSLPPIWGCFRRLEQVMVNLLQNACQALTDQSQAVACVTRFDARAGEVVVVISDEGCGMDRAKLAQIKKPFYTTRARLGGMGLGIAISSAIIEEHRGTLLYESEPGKGTRAIVRIPCSSPQKGTGL